MANLVTNFQDLVTKAKNLVVLVPVLGTILRPAQATLPAFLSPFLILFYHCLHSWELFFLFQMFLETCTCMRLNACRMILKCDRNAEKMFPFL